MKKNNLLRKGAIAMIDDKLVEVAQLDYKDVPVMVKRGFFGRQVPDPTGATNKVLDCVWWKIIGDESGVITTNRIWSAGFDWDEIIVKGRIILLQADWYLKKNPA